ncbi:MAG: homoserine dehydrogenase [Anaerolineales bacterium]|jgi:homoserine dehydrogenase
MATSKLALVGFGNVGRAFARLILAKQDVLRSVYQVEGCVVAVFTARHGSVFNPSGINLSRALSLSEAGASLESLGEQAYGKTFGEALRESQAQLVLETTPLSPTTGEPALSYLETALQLGLDAVTSNKGAVVFGFRRLTELAQRRGRRFLFESTVLDGAPVFSLFRETLPATQLLAFRGILNSTTNFILTEMENGKSLEQAVREAQERGIAEADPAADIDGWDAAFKVSVLAKVLMGQDLLPSQVARRGIRDLSGDEVRRARAEGRPYKLVCSAEVGPHGFRASVRPEQVPLSDPLASVAGTSSSLHLRMDTLAGLTVTEHDPSPATTAFGLLSDWLRTVNPTPSLARG